MNVSSLTPLLSDFYTVQFSCNSGIVFDFKFVVVLLLVVQGGKVYVSMPPSWPDVTSYISENIYSCPLSLFLDESG